MIRLQGMVGSPGIATGRTFRLRQASTQDKLALLTGEAALRSFEELQTHLVEHLHRLAEELRAEGKAEEAGILEAHSMLAEDPALTGAVERLLLQEDRTLYQAITESTRTLADQLHQLEDAYLRERAADIRSIGEQLLAMQTSPAAEEPIPAGAVIVAADLSPAQTALLRKEQIAGIATAAGTATSHVAILARSLGIPAVVGLGEELLAAPDQQQAILDADTGALILAPTAEELAAYRDRVAEQRAADERRKVLIGHPVQTSDGYHVALWANIGHPDETERALDYGAQGVGLFRTEFLFLDRATPPDEEEQYQAYSRVLHIMGDRPVIVRTLDVGGDKPIPYLPQLSEGNPFLGTRGIRFSMHVPDLFRVQVRALLRAATWGNLRVMLPMVASPEDITWAQAQIDAAEAALQQEGVAHRAEIFLGIMIETPAAALTLDLLAPYIRFCSIGSNDLAQYTLAADRTSPALAGRYPDNSPAVFRMTRTAVQAARRLGLEAGFCGNLAGDPTWSIVLIGLGLNELSMAPSSLPIVGEAIRSISSGEAQQRAAQACGE